MVVSEEGIEPLITTGVPAGIFYCATIPATLPTSPNGVMVLFPFFRGKENDGRVPGYRRSLRSQQNNYARSDGESPGFHTTLLNLFAGRRGDCVLVRCYSDR